MLSRAAARNKEYLSLLGVTHVLNTAEQGAGYLSRGTVNLTQVGLLGEILIQLIWNEDFGST